MRKVLVLLILLAGISKGQTIPSGSVFPSAAALTQQAAKHNASVQVNGKAAFNDGMGGTYIYDSTATGTDDGYYIIKPVTVTTGRWMRSINANYSKGNSTFSAISLTTSYVVAHGLSFIPSMVIMQPTSQNAAVVSWVSNINATTFTITFSTIPIVGTNNISFSWIAMR